MSFSVENLSWVRELPKFTDDEQKVLLALSDDRYEWRTKRGIARVTGLEDDRVESILAALMTADLVRPSFSQQREVIYGLEERVH
jgi:hypothetical protein